MMQLGALLAIAIVSLATGAKGADPYAASLAAFDRGDYPTALERARDSVDVALAERDWLRSINSLDLLATIRSAMGDKGEEEGAILRMVGVSRGPGRGVNLQYTLQRYAVFLEAEGRLDEAARLRVNTVSELAVLLGEASIDVGVASQNLGAFWARNDRDQDADAAYRRAINIMEAATGPNSSWVADTVQGYAEFLGAHGRSQNAMDQYKRAAVIARSMGDFFLLSDYAEFLQRMGLEEESARVREEVEELRLRARSPSSVDLPHGAR